MPDIPILETTRGQRKRIVGWLSLVDDYEPGDPPPSGYNDWHEWAKVQHKAGLRQKRCGCCKRWKFPQEIARHDCVECTVHLTKRDALRGTNPVVQYQNIPVCLKCAAMEEVAR